MDNLQAKETVCEFCGQILMNGQECSCVEREIYRAKQRSFDSARDFIDESFADLGSDMQDILEDLSEQVIFDEVKSVSISTTFGVKVTLSKSSNRFIKIKRSDISNNTVEI